MKSQYRQKDHKFKVKLRDFEAGLSYTRCLVSPLPRFRVFERNL